MHIRQNFRADVHRESVHSRREPENRFHPARLSARQESVHANRPAGLQVLVRAEPGYVLIRVVRHLVQVRVVREGRRVGREEGAERVREEGGDFLLVQDGLFDVSFVRSGVRVSR